MQYRGRINKDVLLNIAKKIGLDIDKLNEDLKSDDIKFIIQKNKELAQRLNINGTSYEVIAEAAVESTTDKIYYGEKIVTLAAGDTVQFGMIFSGGGVSPFPSAGTTGNTPNSIYFEKIL